MDRHNDTEEQKALIAAKRCNCWNKLQNIEHSVESLVCGASAVVYKNASNDYVIVAYGLGSSIPKMSPYILHFYELGWNVVALKFSSDLQIAFTGIDAIKELACKFAVGASRLVFFGQSISASSAIYAAADCFVKPTCIIAENPVDSIPDAADRIAKNSFFLKRLKKLFIKWASHHANSLPYAACLLTEKLQMPMLAIASTEDSLCPPESILRLSKDKTYVELAGEHCRSMWRHPTVYWAVIDSFLQKIKV